MFGTCSPPFPPGLPDPPVDVQVEPGPQDGSLLVTWLPVTINSTGGTSNGAPVTGYAVYADGKKVTEVESPTGMCVGGGGVYVCMGGWVWVCGCGYMCKCGCVCGCLYVCFKFPFSLSVSML